MTSKVLRGALASLLLLLCACSNFDQEVDAFCRRNPDRCGEAPDAGPSPDAGVEDAGVPDSGLPDSGVPDAGDPDAGVPDGGTPDGGPLNTCVPGNTPPSLTGSTHLHILFDTSGSMRELPQISNSEHSSFFNITADGCVNPRLDAFSTSRGWDPSFRYPLPDPGTGLGSDNGFPNLFQDDKFYAYMYWNDSSEPAFQWTTKEQACQSQVPSWDTTNAPTYNQCLQCLGTKGYWKLPGATGRDTPPLSNLDFIFWGRFLNFNPPKYVTAKAVLKSIIKDLSKVRVGITHFSNSSPYSTVLQRQNPSCQQHAADASAFDAYRASYINSINGLQFTTGTPLGRSLLNIGYYFTSDDSIYQTRFNFGSSYTYPPEFKNSPLDTQGRSICWSCQAPTVIIITDGEPSSDSFTSAQAAQLRTVNGGPVYCPDSAPCTSGTSASSRDKGTSETSFTDDNPNYYLDDVAKMLYEQDLQESAPPQVGDFDTTGKQNVITYTVGFGINSNLLKHTAQVGGGMYYTADDSNSLRQALLDIIQSSRSRSVFSSSPQTSPR
ncbi:pilus assembly protein [Hyalangium gracile]|uniref:hypothetical protein n=1 Tax=Hyalangium gracile TaxID=394092 RepID=UPI001CCBB0FB|nr:hypothetical protein [Hyalangium gracile]